MSKKNRKSKKLNNEEIKSAVSGAELPEPVPTEPSIEAAPSDPAPQEDVLDESFPEPEAPSSEELSTSPSMDDISAEDLLDDVRRSLIEEETDKHQKESKWWWPIGRKEKEPEHETPPASVEIDLPVSLESIGAAADAEEKLESDEYVEEIDDLIDMLEVENSEPDVETLAPAPEPEIVPEPEPEIDFEKLKEEAFRPRTPEEQSQPESDVRSVALADGEEVFVEVESQTVDPFQERLSAFENSLKPYRRSIYLALAFLGVVVAAIASLIIFNVYQQSRPEPVKEVSNLPYPTAVSLPGGWSFNLGRGTLENGNWEPAGPEWLEGTEVCRWVSLPWSRQLEAVLRTLNPKDPIELVMSNNDKLVYGVYSVYEMTPEEIQKVDSTSPCLLVILTESDSEKRWVLTALP